MVDVLEGSPDELIKSIEREQKSLTAFLAERAELTDEDRVTLKARNDTLKDLRDLASSNEALGKFRDLAKQTTEAQEAADAAEAARVDAAFKSIAKTVMDDEQSSAYLKSAFAMGRESAPVKVSGILPQRKNLVSTAVAGQGEELLRTLQLPMLDLLWRPRTLLDLVSRGTSDADLLEWVETIFTNNAAEVEEATALVGSSGTKPDSDNEMVVRDAKSVTIAHLKHATEKALRNRGFLQGFIEDELSQGLDERIDEQIARGDGVGPNMLGILATSGTQAQAFTTDLITTLVKSATKVRLARSRNTPTVVLSPTNYEELLLTTGPGGGYLFPNALFGQGGVNLLGMRFVDSEVIPVGTAVVGDWSSAHLLNIDSERIVWTDSHQDFFARNIRSCRAEVDVLFYVQRPSQFVLTDLV